MTVVRRNSIDSVRHCSIHFFYESRTKTENVISRKRTEQQTDKLILFSSFFQTRKVGRAVTHNTQNPLSSLSGQIIRIASIFQFYGAQHLPVINYSMLICTGADTIHIDKCNRGSSFSYYPSVGFRAPLCGQKVFRQPL